MPAARLARLRRRARRVLVAEAVAIAAMPPAGVVAVFLIVGLAGFGGWRADLAGLIALGLALRHAIRRYRPPAAEAADRRIERDSRLHHRPLAAYGDAPALAGAAPLWEAHRARTDRALATARVGLPRPDFAAHDPFGLRFLLLLGLIAAWAAAGSRAGSRLAASVDFASPFARPGLAVQAWITPPRWAGATPRLIGAGSGKVTALAGSTLAIIVTGAGDAAPAAWIGGKALGFAGIGTGSFRARETLDRTTTLRIGPFWNRIARERITVIAPTPPRIGFAAPPAPTADARRVALAWRGASRYGLTALRLVLRPVDAPGARADRAALPVAKPHGERIAGSTRLDLLASPLAGMTVDATLAAVNRAGQTGRSAPARLALPAPALHDPTARALEAIRQALARGEPGRPALAARLGTLAATPPGKLTPGTRAALARFAAGFGPTAPDYAQAEAGLWTLVQRAELGTAYKATRQLDAAARALHQALARALAGHPMERARFQQLMQQLDRAMQARRDATKRSARGDQAQQAAQRTAIDRLANQIRQELASGQTAQAARDMARLGQMLNRLTAPQASGSAAAQQQQQQRQAAARRLAAIMREEAKLMDRTARRGAMPAPGGQPALPAQQGAAGLAQRQEALRQQLADAARAMQGEGLPGQSTLGQGQRSMTAARDALGTGDIPAALSGERQAIASLQQAAGALAAMAGQNPAGGGPVAAGQNASGGEGAFGNQNASDVSLGKAGLHSAARQIENALIHRDQRPGLPTDAHRYYGRLLGSE